MSNGIAAPKRHISQGDMLSVGGQTYRVGDALKQPGDNPAFISWRIDPVLEIAPGAAAGSPSRRKVVKLAIGTTAGSLSEDLGSQIAQEREDVLRMEGIKTVPTYYPEDAYSIKFGEEPLEAILVRDFVDGILLSKWMELYENIQQPKKKVFAGVRDVSEWFDLAGKLVDALVPIHNERLVHGDLRPRSIILRGGKDAQNNFPPITGMEVIYLDTEEDVPSTYQADGITDHGTFRRKYDSPLRVFEKKDQNAPFVIANRTPAQWLAPTDIFSLGMILFELAFGSEAELSPFLVETAVAPKTDPAWFKVGSYQARQGNRQLKDSLFNAWKRRLKHLDLWGTTGEKETLEQRMAFLRMREVILACVRLNKNASTTDLEAIQRIIKAFVPSVSPALGPKRSLPPPPGGWLDTVRGGVDNFLANEGKSFPKSFSHLILSNSERLVSRLARLTERDCGFLRVPGRDSIVETIVYLLNGLEKDHCFEALITPSFFSRENVGLHGRVTTALQLAALEGKSVRWLIVVNDKELQSQQVREVLQQHNTAWRHIEKFLKAPEQVYGVSYAILADETYTKLIREQVTSLAIGANHPTSPREGDAYESLLQGVGLLIAPDYHGEMGEISALRLWPAHGQERENRHRVRRKSLQRFFKEHQAKKLQIETFYR